MAFSYDGGGIGKGGEAILFLNGEEVGRGRVENTVAGRFGVDAFDIGEDTGAPVSNTYDPPFAFTGKIERVDIKLAPRNLSETEEDELQERYLAFAQHVDS
jgi:arylsulfatase